MVFLFALIAATYFLTAIFMVINDEPWWDVIGFFSFLGIIFTVMMFVSMGR